MEDRPILKDPPRAHSGRRGFLTMWSQTKALCDSNPGRWVLIPGDLSAGMTTRLRRGAGGFTPAGAYEVTSEPSGNGSRRRVYIRRVAEGGVTNAVED